MHVKEPIKRKRTKAKYRGARSCRCAATTDAATVRW